MLRAVTYGTPSSTALDLGRFRVAAADFGSGLRIPSHFHPRACVSVVLSGRYLQRFPSRAFDCPSGGVIAKPAEERHADEWLAPRSRHVIIEPDTRHHEALGPVRGLVDGIRHTRSAAALTLGRRIDRELGDPDDLTPLAVESLVLELLVVLQRETDAARDEPPAWLLRTRDRLHDSFRDPPGVDDLAADAGVHPSHLSRTFSRYFGTSLGAYQRGVRLEAAKAALATTSDPIAAIAVRTGFSDQSHLTRQLRAATGLTPAAFRRAHRR